MDAVVLVGGEGTRLRPLTLERPKPVLPLLGRPLLTYVLERLVEAGVTRVIFGCGYLPDPIQACFGARELGLALEYVVEPRPLGTAGGIRHAARGRVSETFLALNGDILADAPLADPWSAHRARDAVATIGLTPVADPSRYGLVRTDSEQRVLGSREARARGDRHGPDQRGAYVLDPAVLDLVEDGRAVSIERGDFPVAGRQRGCSRSRRPATGPTSAPRRATSRPTTTCSAGASAPVARARRECALDRRGRDHVAGRCSNPPARSPPERRWRTRARVGAGSSVVAGAEIGARAQLRGPVVQERARVGEARSSRTP